jgi:predicted alpha/beta-hydrolase family hydrolase
MLFIQGTRDDLAVLARLRPIVQSLGTQATLLVLEGADHSFHVLKRSGRTDEAVMEEALDGLAGWMKERAS